jgi:hypothetical protein
MSLVKVWTDVGGRKPVPLLAKIEERDGVIFTIRYLSENDSGLWVWEDDTYEIDDDGISEYLNTESLETLGFKTFGEGFLKDSDEDYVPEDEDEETDLDDEDENDEDENDDDEFEDEDESEAESEDSLDEG